VRLTGPRAALAVYVALAAWIIAALGGIPASRDVLLVLLLGGFLAASLGSRARVRRFVRGLLVDWAPFVLALWLYDLIRGIADGMWLPVHARPQLDLDRRLGVGSVPTVWLQRHLWTGHVHWYDYATWATYFSYFFAPTIVLAVLWWRSRALFRRFAAMVVLLAFAGCATFVVFPAAPPWWASQHHLLPPITRLIGSVNAHIPIVSFQPLWERGTAYANDVAAVPSLHAAYTLLIVLFVVPLLRSRVRHLLWLYPVLMAFALVYSGEHYLTDVLLGWVYAALVFLAVERAPAMLRSRRTRSRTAHTTVVAADAGE
jgi:membrane-associated phospholipid phosphatase